MSSYRKNYPQDLGEKNISQKTQYVFYPPIQAEKPWGTDSKSQAEFCLESLPKAWNHRHRIQLSTCHKLWEEMKEKYQSIK